MRWGREPGQARLRVLVKDLELYSSSRKLLKSREVSYMNRFVFTHLFIPDCMSAFTPKEVEGCELENELRVEGRCGC